MTLLIATPARRRLVVGAGLLAGAVLMFAGGALVARATIDDDPAAGGTGRVFVGDITRGEEVADGDDRTVAEPARDSGPASVGGGQAAPPGRAGAAPDEATDLRAQCSAPMAVAIDGTSIDLSAAGLTPNLPGTGFTLTSLTLRADGECQPDGSLPATGDLVLDSTWRHDETGLEAWVSQRVAREAVANVLSGSYTTFTAGGYTYAVGVHGWVIPVEPDGGIGDGGTTTASPTIDPVPGSADPQARAVVEQIVARLAPDLPLQCFYRERAGTWDDLAAFGIGDPRGAVPAGYSESYLNFVRYEAPADGCPAGPSPDGSAPFYLDASFASSDGGYIGINVHERAGGEYEPWNRVEPGSVAWSSDRYQFYVSGYGPGGPIDTATLTAIARALDGGFDGRCLVAVRDATVDELVALGLRQPIVPDGYTVDDSAFRLNEASGNCGSAPQGAGEFHAFWLMVPAEDGAGIIEVVVNSQGEPGFGGIITPYGVHWTGGDGFSYSVNAYKGAVPEETVYEVARSLDPGFDPSALPTEGEHWRGEPVPLPKPVD